MLGVEFVNASFPCVRQLRSKRYGHRRFDQPVHGYALDPSVAVKLRVLRFAALVSTSLMAQVTLSAGFAVPSDQHQSACAASSLAFGVDVHGLRQVFPQVGWRDWAFVADLPLA